jgi:hypothetical protein
LTSTHLLQALERCPCGRLAAEDRASAADTATFEKRLLPVDRDDGNGLTALIIGSLMTLLLIVGLRGPVYYSNRSELDRDAHDVHRSDCRMKKQESARISKIAAGKGFILVSSFKCETLHGKFIMKKRPQTLVRRRDLLRTMMTGVAAVATAKTVAFEPATAKPGNSSDKRRARYQASSAEVQEFYRVNRYPAR